MYTFGEEIIYSYELLKSEDYNMLQTFSCGNDCLDRFVHDELIQDGIINNQDGLPFKVVDATNDKIIGIVTLAASGIIYNVSNYSHVLPAIKIDVFAIDLTYQKMHYNLESKNSLEPDDHYYFSDDVLNTFIRHCQRISNEMAVAHFVVLYADAKAKRFYERNVFKEFNKYMVKENNMEIEANIPMYLELD